MEERSLRITGTDKNFFNKITSTLTRMLIPTRVGINSMLISVKRSGVIKSFENYNIDDLKQEKKEEYEKKYEEAYIAYLESLDKYVLDSIYKKVKNNTATEFEKQALSKYYGIVQLKESEHVEYKYRKQKYLLELDFEGVKNSGKEKIINRYNAFYISKIDMLYKGILKNYSIKLADTTNKYDSTKEWIYSKIFATLEDYVENVLPIKLNCDEESINPDIKIEYKKYENFEVGKLDTRDRIEKNVVLLSLSRKLFTHSLPLVVVEQCYMKILKDARCLVQDTKIAARREKAYSTLINLIEEYNQKILSTKVYWDDQDKKEEFTKFWNQYKQISNLKETDFVEYVKRKEILFMKNDIKQIRDDKQDYSKIIKYYKRKLVDYGAMKELKGYISKGSYIKNKKVA